MRLLGDEHFKQLAMHIFVVQSLKAKLKDVWVYFLFGIRDFQRHTKDQNILNYYSFHFSHGAVQKFWKSN